MSEIIAWVLVAVLTFAAFVLNNHRRAWKRVALRLNTVLDAVTEGVHQGLEIRAQRTGDSAVVESVRASAARLRADTRAAVGYEIVTEPAGRVSSNPTEEP